MKSAAPPIVVSCHQSSSSMRRMPADRTRRSIAERCHDHWIEPLREPSQRRQIAVIVVVVTEQHRRDRRQVVEPHARLPDSPRSSPGHRARALGIHRIGQEVPGGGLDQERRMADERDRRGRTVECRRHLRLNLDVYRPGRARLAQHPRNLGEWLSGGSGWIDESPAVEVIAHSRPAVATLVVPDSVAGREPAGIRTTTRVPLVTAAEMLQEAVRAVTRLACRSTVGCRS